MTADRLIRLYPRRWRERYGEEFLATVGDEALHVQQIIDIVAGAIDAWLSSDVRRAAQRATSSQQQRNGEAVMTNALRAACARGTSLRFTKRDSLIGAGVMLLTAVTCSVLGLIARRSGWELTSQMLLSLSFPGSMMLSMPFTFMKGQPWRAQVVIIGGTMAFLILITYIATKI